MAFKVGDTVKLKSGSPSMTVAHISKGNDGTLIVDCVWFEGVNEYRGTYPEAALVEDDGMPVIA